MEEGFEAVLWETDATLRGDILRKRGVDLELL
jgi:hypothetical protein